MKLLKFIGKGIRGYMNHEINFRESVTFLVGINGSGKTSVLKLINGLTTPSYRLLETIDYSYIELRLLNDGREYIISSKKDKDMLSISVILPKDIITDEFVRLKSDFSGCYDDDMFDMYSERFSNLKASSIIRNLSTPLFIGIDRMPEDDVFRVVQRHRRPHRYENSTMSTVDNSLNVIQELVFDLYRRNAAKQKKLSDDFRTAIIRESLGLMTRQDEFPSKFNIKEDLEKYEERRFKFVEALTHAGIDDAEDLTREFFDKQKNYLKILTQEIKTKDRERTEALIGWSVSKVQMNKIDRIISHESVYKSALDRLNEPFIRFSQCINLFFKESGKEIRLHDNGLIKIMTQYTTEDGRTRIHSDEVSALSSGEKQIVALIGSLIFASSNVRPEVMIIDEPELSLHLTWQEIFVDAILMAQPNFQFILATHAPTIIADVHRRDWCEDLSRKIL